VRLRSESVTARLTDVEARFKAESERGQKQLLGAFADSLQTRVIHRISKLEEEVARQLAGMRELRECLLRTELNMQKLLGSLDKLLIKNQPEIAEAKDRCRGRGKPSPTPDNQCDCISVNVPESPAGAQGPALSPYEPWIAVLPEPIVPVRVRL
jgi:uncharacterized coiled-coil protein SlyX